MQRMLSLADAAEAVGVSKRHIRRLVDEGQLAAYRLGPPPSRVVRVKEEDLIALFENIKG
ncbi:helix-turn-helix domain-containing protein [Mycobacterium sp. 29Ha]|uniref:helix-turn-helix domain-containing protein n=1 Tax=Mycobacterium sp. 29Ha TaxID=2939268 RepID=UPI002939192D|nr:helix-turn-helix domain-containing protein [Mycobacterium sp. 29Ha]MDV3134110.1 helix-turn-helix domain-containing protein [Mycobacterium sp. 29Ha]